MTEALSTLRVNLEYHQDEVRRLKKLIAQEQARDCPFRVGQTVQLDGGSVVYRRAGKFIYHTGLVRIRRIEFRSDGSPFFWVSHPLTALGAYSTRTHLYTGKVAAVDE